MSESYRAILVNGRLQWLDDVPDVVKQGATEVRVRVTIEEKQDKNPNEVTSLLDELAVDDPFKEIENPVKWQRALRREGHP